MNVDVCTPTEKDIGNYFEWLCGQISSEGLDSNYTALLDDLFSLPFIYSIPMDENRLKDALNLRSLYGIAWTGAVSVLEILVSISERMVYIEGLDMTYWFWEMIRNLGLEGFTDDNIDFQKVHKIIDIWLYRRFKKNGVGSPFPLKRPCLDQRNVEIWYQMQNYIAENYEME